MEIEFMKNAHAVAFARQAKSAGISLMVKAAHVFVDNPGIEQAKWLEAAAPDYRGWVRSAVAFPAANR